MRRLSLKRTAYILPSILILVSVNILFFPLTDINAATEVLKTSRVRVNEKAPLEGSIKAAHEGGKAIVLLLLSNPMLCQRCDSVDGIIKEEVSHHGGVAYIAKGGADMLGATDEETVTLKRLFGFVTMGEPWTFVIDKEGILKNIFIGDLTNDELGAALEAAGK